MGRVWERLRELFESHTVGAQSAKWLVDTVEKLGETNRVMAALEAGGSYSRIWQLKESAIDEAWGPLAVSEAWILEEQVLQPVLGDSLPRHVGYIHDHDDAAKTGSIRRKPDSLPAQTLPDGPLRGNRPPGPASPPQVHLLLPQAPHRPRNQPTGRRPLTPTKLNTVPNPSFPRLAGIHKRLA